MMVDVGNFMGRDRCGCPLTNAKMHCGSEKSRIQMLVLGHSLVRSLALLTRTAHSFPCSALLASLERSAALTRLLAHFAHSLAHGTVND